mmetsp:Transcript_74317/g.214810  ORF Transcript_74317/g.214810 Transcript_74317/m.214810 type:complete len:284 (+) Transcript_74317:804-1655(+)
MSRPRAATSVAISTSNLRFLKVLKMRMREPWSKSPCKNSVFLWRKSEKLCVSSSALAIDLTKINTCPFWSIPSTCLESHCHFSSSFLTTSTCCSTVEAAWPSSPIVMRAGNCKMSRASFSIFGGKVAENNNVCLLGRTFWTMDRTWYSKPRWNILSASSSTTKVTRRSVQPFIFTMSINLPGLHIAISHPRLISLNCSSLERPPANVALRKPSWRFSLCVSCSICTANSRVGHNTTPMGPSPFCNSSWAMQCTNIGKRYATVFPEPVSAMPMMSRPVSAAGMA